MKKLEQLRINKKLTREDLANLLDVSSTTIQNWESLAHPAEPRLSDLRLMSSVFDVEVGVLFTEPAEPERDRYEVIPAPPGSSRKGLVSLLAPPGNLFVTVCFLRVK